MPIRCSERYKAPNSSSRKLYSKGASGTKLFHRFSILFIAAAISPGRKRVALVNYKKSVALNPNNENARKMIDKLSETK